MSPNFPPCRPLRSLLLLLALLAGIRPAAAQGTAFTYQGVLNNGGAPANGPYDLTFTLFGAATAGTALAGPVTSAATTVNNGLFTATIDFGGVAFSGGAKWLEIGVRPAGSGPFTTLAPRQPITPAPYAITAGSLASPPGMVLVPAGPFNMGDSLDGQASALPVVSVTVSSFYMDANLVGFAQWESVYFWATNHGFAFVNVGSGKLPNQPVQTVDWFDAVKWCNARSLQAGQTPAYYTDAALTQVYMTGEVAPYVNWGANGYRLPTEAEWEKAARGGLGGQRFPWGNLISEFLANYSGNTGYPYDLGPDGLNQNYTVGGNPDTSAAGAFAPNGYGLFDMAGNLYQWCWDWYATPYAGGADPRGPAAGTYRVLRGGNWYNDASLTRCATRGGTFVPTFANYAIGFRCVRGL